MQGLKSPSLPTRVAPWQRSRRPLKTIPSTGLMHPRSSDNSKPKHLDLQELRVQRAIYRRDVSSSSPEGTVLRKVSVFETLRKDTSKEKLAHSRSLSTRDDLVQLAQHANELLHTIQEEESAHSAKKDRSCVKREIQRKTERSTSENLLKLIKNTQRRAK